MRLEVLSATVDEDIDGCAPLDRERRPAAQAAAAGAAASPGRREGEGWRGRFGVAPNELLSFRDRAAARPRPLARPRHPPGALHFPGFHSPRPTCHRRSVSGETRDAQRRDGAGAAAQAADRRPADRKDRARARGAAPESRARARAREREEGASPGGGSPRGGGRRAEAIDASSSLLRSGSERKTLAPGSLLRSRAAPRSTHRPSSAHIPPTCTLPLSHPTCPPSPSPTPPPSAPP